MCPSTNIAATDSSHFNPDQHIVVTDLRDGRIANLDGRRPQEDTRPVCSGVDGHRSLDALWTTFRNGHSSEGGFTIVSPCPRLLSRAQPRGRVVSAESSPQFLPRNRSDSEVGKPVSLDRGVRDRHWSDAMGLGAALPTEDPHES